MEGDWFRDGPFWRKFGHAWEEDRYGIYVHGLGDLIYNTLKKILDDDDRSEWAYAALAACKELLLDRKRWPDRMNQGIESRNRYFWLVNRFLYWLKIVKTIKYRPQSHMTRDPFIAFYAACFHMNRWAYIEEVTTPWYLYRATTWSWRDFLITGDPKSLKKYLRVSGRALSNKDYVIELRELRDSCL